MKKKYGLSNAIIAQEDAETLGRFIEVEFKGSVTPEELVMAAKPKTSPIHKLFDWDSLINESGSFKLRPREERVFNAIKKFYPRSFPSMKKLIQITGYCHVTVSRALKDIEKNGVIKIYNRIGTSNAFLISKKFVSEKLDKQARDFLTHQYKQFNDKVWNRIEKMTAKANGKLKEFYQALKKVSYPLLNNVSHYLIVF